MASPVVVPKDTNMNSKFCSKSIQSTSIDIDTNIPKGMEAIAHIKAKNFIDFRP